LRLLVEVPAQSFELTLAEVHSLRANLPRRPKVSPVALLRACYARLHGADPATCSHAFSEPHRLAWSNFKRSVDAVLDGKSASAAAQRHPIILVFDVVAGAFTKHMATAAAAASGQQHELEGGHCRRGSSSIRSEHPSLLGSGVLGAAPRVHTQRVCVLGCRLFVPLFPLTGALFDMSLPFDYRVAAFEQFTNGTREPSPPRARRQAHACRPA
jgi:hypothetical protein